jgi:hypothetical protein
MKDPIDEVFDFALGAFEFICVAIAAVTLPIWFIPYGIYRNFSPKK